MSLRCQRIVPFVFVICSALSTGALAQDPVPTADEQAETLTLVREIYFDDYRAANTAQAKVDLARRILTDGEETVDDPIGRYVLFKLARDIAVQAGDLATTRSAVWIGATFL